MEGILEYMSQQSWCSQASGGQPSQHAESRSQQAEEPPVQCPVQDENPNEHDLVGDELFSTPESENEISSDSEDESDGESDDNEELPSIPSAHSHSPANHASTNSENSENSSDGGPLNWNWVSDDTAAETVPFDFSGETTFTEFPEGEDKELKYFLEFLTPEIVQLIARECNAYYDVTRANASRLSRRMRGFQPITDEDVLRMIAVRICMGVDQKPTQANYWSNSPFHKSEIVPLIITSDRYKEVHRFLHFSDNSSQQEGDRLHKIRNVWNLFNQRLAIFCNPGKNICIDESLVSYKGNLAFRQYIPSKAAKIGIKLFSIGDSATGYILSVMIYEGKGHQFSFSVPDYGFGGALSLELSNRYLHAGRCLYIDNYFVNARLARQLLLSNTNMCGTLRKRLRLNPNMGERMQKGTVIVYSCNGIMVERWKDSREVCIMSTGHHHDMVQVRTKGGTLKAKPATVLEYNKSSRAIDKMDMVTGTYDMNRKCTKWYKKLFFKMIEICLYNANIVYGKKNGCIPILEFKERVVLQILRKYGEHKVRRGRKPSVSHERRFTEAHFLDHIPSTEKKERPSRDCVVCKRKKKRSQTRFMCTDCDVPLCPVPCFKSFHTR